MIDLWGKGNYEDVIRYFPEFYNLKFKSKGTFPPSLVKIARGAFARHPFFKNIKKFFQKIRIRQFQRRIFSEKLTKNKSQKPIDILIVSRSLC